MIKLPKNHIEGALYYVTARGDNNEEIFKEQSDYTMYLDLLKKYKQQYGFKLFSFVLLPNHLHLLFELKQGITISDIMHDLNANYTKYFNARYERKGHLFQERYKMVLFEKTSYLPLLTIYIHLNPKALALSLEPADYSYSSLQLYLGKEDKNLPDIKEEIKEVSVALGEKRYEGFLNTLPGKELVIFGDNLHKESIFGSEDFMKRISDRLKASESCEAKKAAQGKSNRNFAVYGGAGVVCMAILAVFLYFSNRNLKNEFAHLSKNEDIKYSNKLNAEIKFIKKDLTELYRADLVSYQAMQKRLEIEKEKNRQLEEKLK